MLKAWDTCYFRRNSLSASDHVSNARSRNSSSRGKGGDGKRDASLEIGDKEKRNSIIRSLLSLSVLREDGGRYKFTLNFLARLTDQIVSLRSWVVDEYQPVLHEAIMFALIDCGATFEAGKLAEFIEIMFCEDVEFRVTNT